MDTADSTRNTRRIRESPAPRAGTAGAGAGAGFPGMNQPPKDRARFERPPTRARSKTPAGTIYISDSDDESPPRRRVTATKATRGTVPKRKKIPEVVVVEDSDGEVVVIEDSDDEMENRERPLLQVNLANRTMSEVPRTVLTGGAGPGGEEVSSLPPVGLEQGFIEEGLKAGLKTPDISYDVLYFPSGIPKEMLPKLPTRTKKSKTAYKKITGHIKNKICMKLVDGGYTIEAMHHTNKNEDGKSTPTLLLVFYKDAAGYTLPTFEGIIGFAFTTLNFHDKSGYLSVICMQGEKETITINEGGEEKKQTVYKAWGGGGAAINHIEVFLKKLKFDTFLLDSIDTAREFYKKKGFKEVGPYENDPRLMRCVKELRQKILQVNVKK